MRRAGLPRLVMSLASCLLHLLLQLLFLLLLLLRFLFCAGWLRDVEYDTNAQVELAQHSPQLWNQVKLHDLAKERVVPGRVGLELQKMEENGKGAAGGPHPVVTDLQHLGEEEEEENCHHPPAFHNTVLCSLLELKALAKREEDDVVDGLDELQLDYAFDKKSSKQPLLLHLCDTQTQEK
ncbi:hypothetical protein JZ751_003973 [Albula glossodonta]|uniref:Uncharacterized protein n=1 Tax=Albula glossodonta TaxID=121402 RepID=A0A8T2P8E2_9TELE|nr:hypothetical protein JZ751_003973 [Albula glossodonta]